MLVRPKGLFQAHSERPIHQLKSLRSDLCLRVKTARSYRLYEEYTQWILATQALPGHLSALRVCDAAV